LSTLSIKIVTETELMFGLVLKKFNMCSIGE